MARSSLSSPCRSDPVRRWPGPLLAPLLTGLLAGLVMPGAAAAAPGGAVAGTVTVERATLHTGGPKHDRDVVLFLEPVGGGAPPATDAEMSMDQRGLVFIPHVLAVQRGTTVTFLNNDNDQHNVYFLFDETGETLDIGTWGPGVSVDYRFEEAGEVIVLCKLHLEMAAYVLVLDHPWFSTCELDGSGSQASFRIEGVPPGDYTLTAWHKKLRQKGGSARITVAEGGTTELDLVITKPQYARGPSGR